MAPHDDPFPRAGHFPRAPAILSGRVPATCGALLLLLAGGCSGGQKWVEEAPAPERASSLSMAPSSATVEQEHWTQKAPAPRPRLRHVVTLGQAQFPRDPEGSSGREEKNAPQTPIIVHIENNVARETYVGVPYGMGFIPRHPTSVSTQRETRGTPGVAGDWPRIESHGPTFPYKSSPADPWAGR